MGFFIVLVYVSIQLCISENLLACVVAWFYQYVGSIYLSGLNKFTNISLPLMSLWLAHCYFCAICDICLLPLLPTKGCWSILGRHVTFAPSCRLIFWDCTKSSSVLQVFVTIINVLTWLWLNWSGLLLWGDIKFWKVFLLLQALQTLISEDLLQLSS